MILRVGLVCNRATLSVSSCGAVGMCAKQVMGVQYGSCSDGDLRMPGPTAFAVSGPQVTWSWRTLPDCFRPAELNSTFVCRTFCLGRNIVVFCGCFLCALERTSCPLEFSICFSRPSASSQICKRRGKRHVRKQKKWLGYCK